MRRLLLTLLILGGCASDRPHRPIPHPDSRSVAPVVTKTSCCDPFGDLKRDAQRVERDMDREDHSAWNRDVAPVTSPAPPLGPAKPKKSNAKIF